MIGSKRRKLLVASLGVASVSYVLACGKENTPPVSGNLPSPPPTATTPPTGSVAAPAPVMEAGAEVAPAARPSTSAAGTLPPVSGNLPAPPPRDAGATTKGGK